MLTMGNAKMIINTNDYAVIKKFEGFRSKVYTCSAGRKTIGYGTTAYPLTIVKYNDRPITKEEAHLLLVLHINKKVKPAMKGLVLNKFQREAVESFIFNVGVGAFKRSSLRKKLIRGDYKNAGASFLPWNKITKNGKKIVNSGLVKRRKAEKKLFETPTTKEIQVKPRKISFWERLIG